MTGSRLAVWLNKQMLQLTFPAELVVPLQLLGRAARADGEGDGLAADGRAVDVVSVAERVGVCPLVTEVLPV